MTKDEALDLALEALEELQPDDAYPYSLQSKAITAIKQALSAPVQEPVDGTQVSKVWWDGEKLMAKPIPLVDFYQPVQEPVAFNAGVPPLYPEMKDGETISVEYTTPPAANRPWVGLTDKDISDTATTHPMTWVNLNAVENRTLFARILEAKLKEKNT
jgi:hypothetical protein